MTQSISSTGPSNRRIKTKVPECRDWRDQEASLAILRIDLFQPSAQQYCRRTVEPEMRAMKPIRGAPKLVVVIDDDPLVLEATGGLLRSWGCLVVATETYDAAMARLVEIGRRPDFIVCDYRLSEGATGVDII